MSSIREAQRLAALEARVARLETRLAESTAPRLDFEKFRGGNGSEQSGHGRAMSPRPRRRGKAGHG